MNPEHWRTQPWLALASLLPVPAMALWMLFAPRLTVLEPRTRIALTWSASRVLLVALVWRWVVHPAGDLAAFMLPEAQAVLAGGVPYRDFASSYGPLFAPLLALTLPWFGAHGPLVLFLAADLVAWRALAAAEGEDSAACWAYAATPAFAYLGLRYAQDEPLGAMCVALAWLASRRGHAALVGITLGLGFVFTKPLFALVALPFLLASRARAAVAAAAVFPVVVVYGALLALGARISQPWFREGVHFGEGPTLWHALGIGDHASPGAWGWLPLAALLAAGGVRLLRRSAAAEEHAVWQFGAFAALSPKFMPMYAILWAPYLCLWCTRHALTRRGLALYGTLLPLVWYLDSGPRQGMFGPAWQAVAVVSSLVIATLPLLPLAYLWRGGPALTPVAAVPPASSAAPPGGAR